jgi:acyl-CoA hydrolase
MPKVHVVHRLVKGEDLNHHGTLFAGRNAEWFVEAGFIAAASMTSPENIVCVNIHGMVFKKPIKKGSIVRYESRIVRAGNTSLIAYVQVFIDHVDQFLIDGFLTFVHVDKDDQPIPHMVSIDKSDISDVILEKLQKANADS